MNAIVKQAFQKTLAVAISAQMMGLGIAGAAAFQDTMGHWAQKDIEQLSDQNIIGGYPGGIFKPEGYITRAEFSTVLAKALNLKPVNNYYGSFKDVPQSNWAYPFVETVKAQGMISGYPGDLFKPNQSIKRVEVLNILSKALHKDMPSPESTAAVLRNYFDAGEVPAWARPGLALALQNNLVATNPATNQYMLEPNRSATRGEVAAMLSNLRDTLHMTQSIAGNTQQTQPGNAPQNNAALQARVVTIPAQTEFSGALTTPLDSEIARVGDTVVLKIDQPLVSQDNYVVIPNGSQIVGSVSAVKPAERLGRNAEMQISFEQIVKPSGERLPIRAQISTETGMLTGGSTKGRVGKALLTTALGAGAGAALGTAMGPLSGGKVGKGAIYGTAVGAGAGALAAAAQKGEPIKMASGDHLVVKLQQPIAVSAETNLQQLAQPLAQQPVLQLYQQQLAQEQQLNEQYYAQQQGLTQAQNPLQQTAPYQARVATIAENTVFTGTLQTNLSSQLNRVGDQVVVQLDQPLLSQDNMVVFPAGSQIMGKVATIDPVSRLGKNAEVVIDFNEILKPNGEKVQIQARVATEDGALKGGSTKGRVLKAAGKTALGAGLGAALGTAMGPLSGGKVGKGAIYGTAVGAGAGAVAAAADKGEEVLLPRGEQLQIKLTAPVTTTLNQ
ncbi:MAG: S-layer homology domain-containing protein [Candidatus Melainabacteria bacterium]